MSAPKPCYWNHWSPPSGPLTARVAAILTLVGMIYANGWTVRAASADWAGAGANVNWATTANWTTGAAPGATTTNSDVAGFKSTFTGARQPTYPNSAYYVGAFWLGSGLTKDVTVTDGGTSGRGLLYGVDGAAVGLTTGTYYGVVIDSSLSGRKLTLGTRSVELRTNSQTFYVATGNTLVCGPAAAPQYTALNGNTLTIGGGGSVQLKYLNNNASLTGGAIVVTGGTRVDLLGTSLGGVAGGLDVKSGMLVFWANTCMGAAGSSSPLTLENGAQIDSGGVAISSASPLTITGDITFGGYGNLDWGTNAVKWTTATPTLTCNASTGGSVLTLGGAITNTAFAGGNALDLTKAGVGTLTITAPITLRASQTATVSGGVENLNSVIGGSGFGITLAGAGTLNLNANNTFTGPLGINGDGGTLNVNGTNSCVGASVGSGRFSTTSANTGAGAYTVAAGATLAVKPVSAGATLNVTSLTLAAGATNELNFNSFGNPTNALITVSGALTPTSTATLNLIGSAAKTGMYPLIKAGSLGGSGISGLVLGTVAPGAMAGLVASNNTVYLAITNLSAQVWDGTVNSNWDLGTTANWKTNAVYTEAGGFPVLFDDTAAGANTNISLVGTLSPSAITVNGTAKAYSFSGAGTLAGSGTLTKQGSSTLTITTSNTISGQALISAGTLQLGDGTTANGYLGGNITANATLTFANPLDQTYSGIIDGAGWVTKTGAGNLTLGQANSFASGTVINAGTVTLGNAYGLGSGPVYNNSGTNTATLALAAGYTIYNNFNVTAGTLRFLNADASASFPGSFTGSGTAFFGRTGLTGARSVTLSGDWSGFTGTLGYQNGAGASSTYLTLSGSASDFSQAVLYTSGQTASDTFLNWNGANNTTIKFGALSSGAGGGHFGIASGVTGVSFEIGAKNTDSVYGGVIGGGAAYGAFALTKVGVGGLQLWNGNSAYNGVTTVRNGSLLAYANAPSGANGALGNAVSAIQMGDAGTASTNNLALLSGAAVTIGRPVSVNGYNTSGTITLGGVQTNGTSTFSGAVALNHNVMVQSLNTDGSPVKFSGNISGTNFGITKIGGGEVQLLGTNTYSGLTVVSNGTLLISTRHLGGGDVTVTDGMTFGVWNWKNNASAAVGNMGLGASGPTTNEFWEVSSPTVPLINAATLTVNGVATVNIKSIALATGWYPLISYTNRAGAGSIVLGTLPPYVAANLVTSNNTLYLNVTGIVPTLWTGATDGNWNLTTANWTNSSTAANVYADGAPVRFDDTALQFAVTIASNVSPASVLVANSASDYQIGGVIAGSATLTKTGARGLTLAGANTYTGATVVSNGTLTVSGSLASPVSLAGGVLAGTGSVNGGATVQSGGTLAPQNMGSGALTINNQLVLTAGAVTRMQVNKDFSASDQITVTNVVYGGTLAVTNLSGTLALGDSFALVTAPPATFTGNFAAITGSPGAGLAWSFDPTNGLLSVVNPPVAPSPTNLVPAVIGGQLVLTWPNGQGWLLEVQTNSLTAGLGSNWVTNSAATSPFTNAINPANGAVFFRLIYP